MNRILKFTICLMMALLFISVCSCQSDGPDNISIDYGKLHLGKIDLSGAKHLALKTGDVNSRAIDGEYLSAGLYKIDDNGNIAAVGVYFTTDSDGNRLEREYVLKVAPQVLLRLTDNYMLAVECDYYDADGDFVFGKWIPEGQDDVRWIKQSVPYSNLLIRLSDGKIWCVDNIHEKIMLFSWSPYYVYYLNGFYQEDPYGTLYLKEGDRVYRFNLDSDIPSFEQVVLFERISYDNLHITLNGVLSNYNNNNQFSEIEFAWPHSGFQILDVSDFEAMAYGEPIMDLEENYENLMYRPVLDRHTKCAFSFVQNKPHVLLWTPGWCYSIGKDYYGPYSGSGYYDIARERYWSDVARFYEISVGDTPGSVKLKDNYIMLTDIPESARSDEDNVFGYEISSVYADNSYILTCGTHNWVTLLDLDKREWKWLKQLDYELNLESGNKYANKIFVLSTDWSKFGVYWFDLQTMEDGFTPFNIQLPEYIEMSQYIEKSDWDDGILEFQGRNPSTGNIEVVYIDILTGEAQTETSEIEMMFETIISLN